MRKILGDFYFGNLTPSERQMTHNSNLMRAAAKVSRCEQQLTEQLDETGQALLTELIQAQHEIDNITACENFTLLPPAIPRRYNEKTGIRIVPY